MVGMVGTQEVLADAWDVDKIKARLRPRQAKVCKEIKNQTP